MICFVSGATATHRRDYWGHPSFGHLITPRAGNSIKVLCESGKPWGADNDAYHGWDQQKELSFSKMLGRICRDGSKENCKFVSAPDAVADAATTLERFDRWEPIIRACGLPVALVAQDGLTIATTPWDRIECLFIGGTTEWKLSEQAERLLIAAKARGKWAHVGRVNTARRIRHFHEIGVDSIDGQSFSKWPDEYFPAFLRWLGRLNAQQTFIGAST